MSRLLVSVRDVAEALTAVDAGVDLIDIKEPLRGALGAADAKTIADIVQTVDGRVPVSVALGELLDPSPGVELPRGVAYAKVGLAGCADHPNWKARWRKFVSELPSHVTPVAVVYADNRAAHSPAVEEIIPQAVMLGCGAVLVDTFEKSAGPITAHWPLARIHSFVLDIRRRDMLVAIAGSLTESLIAQVLAAEPEIIAVRGAVCCGDRTATIDVRKVYQLRSLIDTTGGGVGITSFIEHVAERFA